MRQHLGLPEPGPDTVRDYEEEFYYTEIEDSEDVCHETVSESSGEMHDMEREGQSQSIHITQAHVDSIVDSICMIISKFLSD